MHIPGLSVVTGAFSYTGRYIAERLLGAGRDVRTLTAHPQRPNPFAGALSLAPLDFSKPAELTENLRGATTLYNTYWIRFPRGGMTFDQAVANTHTLLRAARDAGVRRIVHLSVTNPSLESPLPYFRGKALVEQAIVNSGLSYAIIRPTLMFGGDAVLVNNIAWMLRHLPLFGIFASGNCRLQPIFVEDLATLCADLGESDANVIRDAAGPETFTFEEFLRLIAKALGSRCRLVHTPPAVALLASRAMGILLRDVVLTRDEVTGLMSNLLISSAPPLAPTRFSEWLQQERATVGVRYISDLRRHFR